MDRLYKQIVTIAANGTVSTETDLRNRQLVGLVTDADFVTATLTFKASLVEGDTKLNCLDYAGAAVNLTGVLASQYYLLNSSITESLEYITLTSSASQTSGTTITLITKERV